MVSWEAVVVVVVVVVVVASISSARCLFKSFLFEAFERDPIN